MCFRVTGLPAIFFGMLLFAGCNKKESGTPTTTDANFSITGFERTTPCTINFINTSKNATSYLWNFGDGTTDNTSNPSHTYVSFGTYLLKLRATGPNGTDSVCKLVSIEPPVAANKAAFSYFFDRCSGTPVGAVFKTVNPLATNTVWDFGNGNINVNRDPIIQFLIPGDYTIKYSAQFGTVRDTVTRIIRIQ